MAVPDGETPQAFYRRVDEDGDLMIHYSEDPEAFRHSKAAGVDHNTRNRAGRTALMEHALAGRTGIMEVLLQVFGSDGINLQDPRGDTALHLAARGLRNATVTSLLNHGADATVLNKQGWPPLLVLLKTGLPCPPIMIWELSRPPVRPVVATAGLFLAAKADNAAVIPALLEAGADVAGQNKAGLTPFLAACSAGSIASAKVLFHSHSECLEQTSSTGKTALQLARARGHANVVSFLSLLAETRSAPPDCIPLDVAVAGCLPKSTVRAAVRRCGPQSDFAAKALALALNDLNSSLARVLIEEGVNPFTSKCLEIVFNSSTTLTADCVMGEAPAALVRGMDCDSLSCMANAAVSCHRFDLLLHILRAGVPISVLDRNGYDFVFSVSYEGNFECIRALAESGLDVGLTCNPSPESGDLPVICAAISKHSTVAIRALVAAGVKLDAPVAYSPEIGNITGFACMAGTPEVIDLVFELGGHLDNVPREVQTSVLLQAAKNGFQAAVLRLLGQGVRPDGDVLTEVARFNMCECLDPLLQADAQAPVDSLTVPHWDSAVLFMDHGNLEAARLLLGPRRRLRSRVDRSRCRSAVRRAMAADNFGGVEMLVELFGGACLQPSPGAAFKAILDHLFVDNSVGSSVSCLRDALEARGQRRTDAVLALVHHPAMFRACLRSGDDAAAAVSGPEDAARTRQVEYDKWVEAARRVASGEVGLDGFQDALKSPLPSPDFASLEVSGVPVLWHLASDPSPKALSLAKALMRCGASPTMLGPDGSPIMRAAALGTVTMVAAMLKAVPDLGSLACENAEHETAFTIAMKHGNADVLAELAKVPELPERELARGRTPLMLACAAKNRSAVKVVLSMCAGAASSASVAAPDGTTALQIAIDECPGADERVDVNAVCPALKRTPLELACMNGAADLALLLLRAGAEPACPTLHGWHCSVEAALLGQADTAHAILASEFGNHPSIPAHPSAAYQALAGLAEKGQFDAALQLLRRGGLEHASSEQVATVREFATACGWHAALDLLKAPALPTLSHLVAELRALATSGKAAGADDEAAGAAAAEEPVAPSGGGHALGAPSSFASAATPSAGASAAAAVGKALPRPARSKPSKVKGKPSKGSRRAKA
ncbi:hypothetical protein FNF29_06778 [Cafeteria roenbergensis]|uniref:Uncharacterized protein n=1 Tax=Cafeteria roenbergensis TaxID=33653 RepID=A0A5A8C8R1_CAFRO|nr:hypothetical protein FNF29_06778 [Cafeteria roenbergensis]|eukprot:KAA0148241.1 hypothetical protein FNF29_06778 [Cafeteria roenbergensis]